MNGNGPLTRREALRPLVAGLAAPLAAPAARPNIVVILADDMGFSDLGCYGSEIATPHLDGLARNGLRFTRFYNAARCCPTRASLLTGLYPHQAGVGDMDQDRGKPAYRGFLSENCVTIAEALRSAGYRTMMAGKWHVGEKRPHWPADRGFDDYFGLISGGSNYFSLDPDRTMALGERRWQPSDPDFYMTDAFTDHACSFLEQHRGRPEPFFLYLAFTSPHYPLHARPADIERYRDRYRGGWDELHAARFRRQLKLGIVRPDWSPSSRPDGVPAWEGAAHREWQARRMAVYAAQVDNLDRNVGRVLRKLRDRNAWDDTLILFLSDNGGERAEIPLNYRKLQGAARTLDGRQVHFGNDPKVMPGPADTWQSYGEGWAWASNTPFRRFKKWMHEGGVATPLIAHWPRRVREPGGLTHQPGHVIDIMATCLDAAGAAYPRRDSGRTINPVEGRSLLPVLDGRGREPHPALYWEHQGSRAVLQGRWKLVSAAPSQRWELYDLEADRTEMNDLTAAQPDRAALLSGLWSRWASRVGVM